MDVTVSPARQAASNEKGAEIQEWMVGYLVKRHRIDKASINVDTEFLDYGLDSAAALQMMGDLEDHLGRKLSPSMPYEHPTIRSLSQALAALR